jgi:molybdopterin/thiamine biosynthesis adenylyltransferase
MKTFSVAVGGETHRQLAQHLIRRDRQEDLCFATYVPSYGKSRFTGILSLLIMPQEGEREVHGNASFYPAYFQRALQIAGERREGLVLLHSHPGPGWQGMSHDDIVAEKRLSPAVMSVTQLPLLGMTIGSDETWSGRFWTKHPTKRREYVRDWCRSVRVFDERLSISYHPELALPSVDRDTQMRTISAWGIGTQQDLSRLTVGIVGLGSVGSMVAEALSRTGFSRFVLIDFDRVERKNLDRLTNVFAASIGKLKVDAVAKGIQRSKTIKKASVTQVPYSICEKEGYELALDCDVLFSCVDRPWPRQVLNYIAYAHFIPVIDGGIAVSTNNNNTKIKGADWKIQTVGHGRPCLECLGQYTSDLAALEKAGFLEDPAYIAGMVNKSVVDAHENVFVFSSSLASFEVMQLLSLVIAPCGIANVGQQFYHFKTGALDSLHGQTCHENCIMPTFLGKADAGAVVLYGRHEAAERQRKAIRE